MVTNEQSGVVCETNSDLVRMNECLNTTQAEGAVFEPVPFFKITLQAVLLVWLFSGLFHGVFP